MNQHNTIPGAERVAERRRFGMSPGLLKDVIKRQAGTLTKAVMEAVMNAVDAGATRCEIRMGPDRIVIEDDGIGFPDIDSIENFFETFGREEKDNSKVYGFFGMGRGQLFAFGINTWLTHTFRMEIDIEKDGLDYHLSRVGAEDAVNGCRIEIQLYQPQLPSGMERMEHEIREALAYVPLKLTMNGERIDIDRGSVEWTVETEEALFLIQPNRSKLDLYNLGVHVSVIPNYSYGFGGAVVSKKQLKVNFARNMVLHDCPVMAAIAKVLKRHAVERTERKPRMNDAERRALTTGLLEDEIDKKKVLTLQLITDVRGKHHTLGKAIEQAHERRLAVAPRGDRVGERMHLREAAFVMAEETLDRFGARSAEEFIARVKQILNRDQEFFWRALLWVDYVTIIDRQTMVEEVDAASEEILDKDLIAADLLRITALRKGFSVLQRMLYQTEYLDRSVDKDRELRAGASEVAEAWTDGSKTVWIRRGLLRRLDEGWRGAARLCALLAHEMIHRESDSESHTHDLAFYEAFHEIVLNHRVDPIGEAAQATMLAYAALLKKEGKKIGRSLIQSVDLLAVAGDLEASLAGESAAG